MVSNDCKEYGSEGECKGKVNGKYMVWTIRGRKIGVGSVGLGVFYKGFIFLGVNCF